MLPVRCNHRAAPMTTLAHNSSTVMRLLSQFGSRLHVRFTVKQASHSVGKNKSNGLLAVNNVIRGKQAATSQDRFQRIQNWLFRFVNRRVILWHCWLGGRKTIRPLKKLSDGMLAWLSVWRFKWFAYVPAATPSPRFLKIQKWFCLSGSSLPQLFWTGATKRVCSSRFDLRTRFYTDIVCGVSDRQRTIQEITAKNWKTVKARVSWLYMRGAKSTSKH